MGHENLCRNRKLVGMHRPGGFTEQVAVPVRNLFPLPDGTPPAGVALVEPLANGFHAARRLNASSLRTAAVIGAGAIGLCCALALRQLGVPRLLIADVDDARLAAAAPLAPELTVNSLSRDLAEAAAELTDGEGLDGVIDAVGRPATREQSVAMLRPGAAAAWIGMGSDEVQFSGMHLVTGERSVMASYAYTAVDFQRSIDTLLAGGVPVERWTRIRPLDQGVEAWFDLLQHREHAPRVLLRPATSSV
jgi:threonine dehydrogenase-like Zn-dependent dehydrogenase